ncbi:MAG TPA: hypothetical protein ENG95_02400 [Nitrospirae bacterium]|nr:hypothetical protein BMS3Bbin08_02348 [bacterium BMS3Bbin08]HDH51670.1 hypothetical protein [Nitrospirota bacterium]HDK16341.1 hypothetical protein [Nitrospirota bacterium]HDO25481.1 hypothetical protein [Nitrospirota bacterium]HDZ84175.1 hypothetical protein [Nitrospirota bacterium]
MADESPAEDLDIIMPEEAVTRDFQKLFDEKDADLVTELAKKYNVSETVMTLRLIDLSLV